MEREMTLDYRLRWLDFDRYGRMRPETILDLFQDVATLQADDMGIGHDEMSAHGLFWAIVRMKYEIVKEPERFQVVKVRTWPHSLTNFSFLRDFQILDEAGELLVKASSEWVAMSSETRKFAKVKDVYSGPTDFVEDRAFDAKMRKVASFDDDSLPVFEVIPSYSDIDINGHVNNARYTNFIVDALNPNAEGSIKSFQIDFRHEVLAGRPLAVHTRQEDGLVLSKGVRDDGNVAFNCAIELR